MFMLTKSVVRQGLIWRGDKGRGGDIRAEMVYQGVQTFPSSCVPDDSSRSALKHANGAPTPQKFSQDSGPACFPRQDAARIFQQNIPKDSACHVNKLIAGGQLQRMICQWRSLPTTKTHRRPSTHAFWPATACQQRHSGWQSAMVLQLLSLPHVQSACIAVCCMQPPMREPAHDKVGQRPKFHDLPQGSIERWHSAKSTS